MVEVIDVHGLPMISAYLKESKDVFIFSARALVPGHGTKLMVLCSHSQYPSCLSSNLLHQQMPFLQKERSISAGEPR